MPASPRLQRIVLAAAMLAALSACAPADDGSVRMDDGWQYRWGDSPRSASGEPEWARSPWSSQEGWAAHERPNMPPNRPAAGDPAFHFLWLRRQLPAPLPDAAALYLPWVDQNFEAFVDGRRIGAYGDLAAQDVLGGSPFHLLRLERGDAGKTLYLRVRSSYESIGVFGGVRLGERGALVRQVVRRGAPVFALGIGLLAGALLGCAILVFSWRDKRVALLCALSACCGVYSLSSVYSPIKHLLTDHTILVWYLEFGSLFLLPACYFGFYEAIAPPAQKRIARGIWIAYVAFAVFALGYSASGEGLPTAFLGPSQLLLLVGMVAGIVMATRSALAGQGGAAIFLAGLVSVALAGGYDVLGSMHVIHTDLSLFVWGFMLFIGGIATYVMRTYAAMLRERSAWEDQLRSRNLELTEARARIEQAATRLTVQAQGILAAATQQSSVAQQQAESNVRTHATVGEIEAASRSASASALSVVESARRSEEMSRKGEQVVGEAVAAMENLGGAVGGIAREVGGLAERSQKIEEIVATVAELAEQTTLLALNAELQAAHSGEHGKGFAVVATEMRRLAQQSREAADRIRGLLAQIQNGTQSVVDATEQGNRSAGRAVELARQAGQSITSLARLISESSGVARTIAESAQGQTAVVDQIAQAVGTSSQALQSSAAGVRKLEDSARDLLALSDQLARLAKGDGAPTR